MDRKHPFLRFRCGLFSHSLTHPHGMAEEVDLSAVRRQALQMFQGKSQASITPAWKQATKTVSTPAPPTSSSSSSTTTTQSQPAIQATPIKSLPAASSDTKSSSVTSPTPQQQQPIESNPLSPPVPAWKAAMLSKKMQSTPVINIPHDKKDAPPISTPSVAAIPEQSTTKSTTTTATTQPAISQTPSRVQAASTPSRTTSTPAVSTPAVGSMPAWKVAMLAKRQTSVDIQEPPQQSNIKPSPLSLHPAAVDPGAGSHDRRVSAVVIQEPSLHPSDMRLKKFTHRPGSDSNMPGETDVDALQSSSPRPSAHDITPSTEQTVSTIPSAVKPGINLVAASSNQVKALPHAESPRHTEPLKSDAEITVNPFLALRKKSAEAPNQQNNEKTVASTPQRPATMYAPSTSAPTGDSIASRMAAFKKSPAPTEQQSKLEPRPALTRAATDEQSMASPIKAGAFEKSTSLPANNTVTSPTRLQAPAQLPTVSEKAEPVVKSVSEPVTGSVAARMAALKQASRSNEDLFDNANRSSAIHTSSSSNSVASLAARIASPPPASIESAKSPPPTTRSVEPGRFGAKSPDPAVILSMTPEPGIAAVSAKSSLPALSAAKSPEPLRVQATSPPPSIPVTKSPQPASWAKSPEPLRSPTSPTSPTSLASASLTAEKTLSGADPVGDSVAARMAALKRVSETDSSTKAITRSSTQDVPMIEPSSLNRFSKSMSVPADNIITSTQPLSTPKIESPPIVVIIEEPEVVMRRPKESDPSKRISARPVSMVALPYANPSFTPRTAADVESDNKSADELEVRFEPVLHIYQMTHCLISLNRPTKRWSQLMT